MIDFKRIRLENNMTQQQFANAVGVSLRSIQSYEKGNTKPSADVLIRIMQLDTKNVSQTAEELTVNNNTKDKSNAIWVDFESFMLVPLVGQRAQAGFLSGYDDPQYLEELPKIPFEVNKEYKGKYLCFEVAGDSMDNNDSESILEGDILLCREVQKTHWQNKLHINKWDFVIAHKDEGILCKRIIEHDTQKGTLTLHSLNSYYEDFKVNLDDLVAIYNIVDVKRSRRR